MSTTINKVKRDRIKDQALKEIQFARTYKQGIIWRWQRNEDLYYARKYGNLRNDQIQENVGSQNPVLESRANVELGKMQSFVESVLSKIDAPLTFKYLRGSMADLKRAKLLNALKDKDANLGFWDFKDLVGKKQVIIYGRAIYSYYADSYKGYCSHLEPVDVYDFLIDPSGSGYDLDLALYMGRFGVKKNKQQLRDGIKEGIYIRDEAQRLINGSGNIGTPTDQEDVNKQNRYSYVGSPANRSIEDTDIYKLWEWYTTYEGERYYLLLQETGGVVVRIEKLEDIFPEDELLGHAMWPFWSYAVTPDMTEFWTPSKCDYVREIFMAQATNINQMLDNSERINKPQRGVDISTVDNLADLIYKRNGIVRFKAGTDINKSFKIVETPQINTPLAVYDKLETIQQIESGVTAAAKGSAEEDKVGIYEGNLAQTADRFSLLQKSYSFGYKRFAKLYWYGVEGHLTKKTAVKILGPKGLEKTVFISKRDIKPQTEYEIMIESSTAEAQVDASAKRTKIAFFQSYKNNPLVNQKELFELEGEIVGLSSDEIRALLDTEEYGTAEVIGEAERDMEDLLMGKVIEPNLIANTAYMQYINDYLKDHTEDMSEEQFLLFTDYLEKVEPIVIKNLGTQMMKAQAMQPEIANNTQQQPNDIVQKQEEALPPVI